MDAERPDDALTASALDREIRKALAVDPSSEFVARVRTRIASEPGPSAWHWSWMFATAGAAVAALIAITVVVSRPREVSPTFPADRMPLQARMAAPFSQLVFVASDFSRTKVGVASGSSRTKARSADARRTVRLKPDATQVLLDPAETRALRRLIAGTRDGTLDLSASLQATTPPVMDLAPLDEIAIPVITIDPITPQAGQEGARQ